MPVSYTHLPIIKNTVTGLDNINGETLEAAKGIGLNKFQVLYKVQIPLAAPVIMAGVRVSAVSSVGLMTLAAFIGADGLGYLVYAGIRTVNNAQILAGAIPACLLALLIDYIFSILERLVTPKSFQLSKPRSKMKGTLDKVVIVISCLALAASFVYTGLAKTNGSQVIRIGSMDFTEQEILNYMLKYYIEDHTDIEVEQSLSLGSSSIVLDAVRTGSIDMYVEYTGTIYGNVLGNEPNGNVDEVYNAVKEQMKEQYDLNVLDSLGFNNTYTLAIRKDTAEPVSYTHLDVYKRQALSKKGYIERVVDLQDKRKIKVFITDKGRIFAQQRRAEIEDYFKKMLEMLGEEDTKEYLRLYRKVNQIIKALK